MTKIKKKRVKLGDLPIGAVCYPPSHRGDGRFLKTEWKIVGFDQETQRVILKYFNKRRFHGAWRMVLVASDV